MASDVVNPYAPPADDRLDDQPPLTGQAARRGYRIEGDVLIAEDGVRLPKICIRSGAKGANERTQQLVFIPLWARMLFGALSLLSRRKASLTYYLSDHAVHQQTVGRQIMFAALAGGFVVGLGAMFAGMHAVAFIAFVGLVAGAIVGGRKANVFQLQKIEDEHIYLKLKPDAVDAFNKRLRRARKKRRKKRAQRDTA